MNTCGSWANHHKVTPDHSPKHFQEATVTWSIHGPGPNYCKTFGIGAKKVPRDGLGFNFALEVYVAGSEWSLFADWLSAIVSVDAPTAYEHDPTDFVLDGLLKHTLGSTHVDIKKLAFAQSDLLSSREMKHLISIFTQAIE
jgi:hypothetical protein